MNFRTDSARFTDLNYVQSVYYSYAGIIGPYSPEMMKQISSEFYACNEYYKGAFEVLLNISKLGLDTYITFKYFSVIFKTGASIRGIKLVLEYTLQLTREAQAGAGFVRAVAQYEGKITNTMQKFGSASTKFLAFLTGIQMLIHFARGQPFKALGELAKTAMSSMNPPMALIDLIDSIIGLVMPDWMQKWPIVRIVRGLNPAQCTSYIAENISWLCYISGIAYTQNWTMMNDALAKWCAQMEASPMMIYTQMSRRTAVFLDENILSGSWSRAEFFGASIHNLADYTRQSENKGWF